jgi:hypothetical protein
VDDSAAVRVVTLSVAGATGAVPVNAAVIVRAMLIGTVIVRPMIVQPVV